MATPIEPGLTVYTTTWCGDCHRLKRAMERSDVAYREIDIERDQAAADFVVQVNDGNETVPTVVFPDGSVLAEPSLHDVLSRLAETSTSPPD